MMVIIYEFFMHIRWIQLINILLRNFFYFYSLKFRGSFFVSRLLKLVKKTWKVYSFQSHLIMLIFQFFNWKICFFITFPSSSVIHIFTLIDFSFFSWELLLHCWDLTFIITLICSRSIHRINFSQLFLSLRARKSYPSVDSSEWTR